MTQILRVEGLKRISVLIGYVHNEVNSTILEMSSWIISTDETFPSYPSLQCVQRNNCRANIYSGEIYLDDKIIDKITGKNMKTLWTDIGFWDEVSKIRSSNQCPKIDMPDIPYYFREK